MEHERHKHVLGICATNIWGTPPRLLLASHQMYTPGNTVKSASRPLFWSANTCSAHAFYEAFASSTRRASSIQGLRAR
eukprot:1158309-Pelagomonas_calceolata.AAC.16